MKLWDWAKDDGNNRAAKLLGGACVVLVAGTWTFFTYFAPHVSATTSMESQNQSGPSVGRDFNVEGDQNNNYGITQEHYDKKIEELGAEKLKRQEWESRYYELEKKFRELEKRLQPNVNDSDQLRRLKGQALQQFAKGEFAQVERLLLQATEYAETELASLRASLGDLKFIESDYTSAADLYAEAADLSAGYDVQQADYLNSLGNALYKLEKCDQAEPILAKSLALQEKLLEKSDPKIAKSLNDLAVCLKKLGKEGIAEEQLKRASNILKEQLNVEPFFVEGVKATYQWDNQSRKEKQIAIDLNKINRRYKSESDQAIQHAEALATVYSNWDDQVNSEYFFDLANALGDRTSEDVSSANRYLKAANNSKIQILEMLNLELHINEIEKDLSDKIKTTDALYREAIRIFEEKLGAENSQTINAKKDYRDFLQRLELNVEVNTP